MTARTGHGRARRGALGAAAALALLAVFGGVAAPSPLGAQQRQTTPARRTGPAKKPAAAAPKKTAATPPAKAVPLGSIAGILEDSVRMEPLVGATVRVAAARRSAVSDRGGRFVVDSVPPGEYDVVVSHPILDSLLITLDTTHVRVVADSTAELLLATPSVATLLGGACAPATRTLGPSAFAGRVLDADTRQPAAGVRVALVWTQLSAGTDIGVRPMPRVRTATTDAHGFYRICGVPSDLDDATIQAERGAIKTAEVPASVGGADVGLRSLLIGSAGSAHRAAVAGRIVDTAGAPLERAQVSIEGASELATTNARGEFLLDSVPSGTQALVARRIGFAPSRTIVDLASGEPVRVALRLGRATPRLNPVVVTAQAEALSRVGFEDRQKHGMGHYLGPDQIAAMRPQLVTSALRMVPGLQVVPAGAGSYTVQSSRGGGCVSYWVDGAPFQEQNPGDVDAAFQASQLAAVEVYAPSEVPAQFTTPGQSSCTTVVLWTQASVRRKK